MTDFPQTATIVTILTDVCTHICHHKTLLWTFRVKKRRFVKKYMITDRDVKR